MIEVILILAGSIIGVGIILRLLHRPDAQREGEAAQPDAQAAEPEGCCGQHAVCERDSLIAGLDQETLYFDDEELDAYRGRDADSYTDEEQEQFRDVMLTLLPDDVAPWARSIAQRGITLPADVREELLMLVDDIRQSRLKQPHTA